MPIRIRTLMVAVLAVAGTLAAIAAHVAIDVVGDFALAHDAYDGFAHESRGLLLGFAVLAMGAIVLRALWDALVRRSGSLLAVSRRVESGPVSAWTSAALVCAVALIVLVGMEALDCRLAGSPVRALSDLLGGSILLGSAITLACGVLTTLVCRLALSAIAAWEPRLAAWLGALRRRGRRTVGTATYCSSTRFSLILTLPVMATRRGTRAPPHSFPIPA